MTETARALRRRDPAWWTPPWVPEPLRDGPGERDGRHGVHETVGLLDVDLAPLGGATRVVRQFHRTPLYVLRPIYLDPNRPGMAFLYLQQHGDGLVQGDRYRIDVSAAPGAEVHLTTQVPTKVYATPAGYATQRVNIAAAAGSVVEYLPDPVIPFRGSRFFGTTTITAHPAATVLVGETLLPGRVARGEWHDYDLFWTTTRVVDTDGIPKLSDTLSFGSMLGSARSPARLGQYGVHAVLFALGPGAASRELCGELRDVLADDDVLAGDRVLAGDKVLAGVSLLPADCGVGVRILGGSSSAVSRAMLAAWDSVRRHLLGVPAPDLRKG